MDDLLTAISELVYLVSPEKVRAIAIRVQEADVDRVENAILSVVGTPVAVAKVERLIEIWRDTTFNSKELASMLMAASYMFEKVSSAQSTELVWTGPTTPVVAARRTEQALLQVINAAKDTLFITSFVAYDVSSIVKALNAALSRGVAVSMLLESSQSHGGSINIDVIGKMRSLVPQAKLYAWIDKEHEFFDGRVHAKVAVADAYTCFITSANLTGYAMEKNMEAGVLISGGRIPVQLDEQLRSLIDIKVIALV